MTELRQQVPQDRKCDRLAAPEGLGAEK